MLLSDLLYAILVCTKLPAYITWYTHLLPRDKANAHAQVVNVAATFRADAATLR